MSDKHFLDTNILVYTFDDLSKKKQTIALELVEQSIKSGRGIISNQVVQEFLNVALSKFKVPFTENEAQLYLSAVLRPLCMLHSSIALYDLAVRLKARYSFSFYDSLIVAAAVESDCRTLYSEDFQAGLKIEGLTIVNPFAA